MTRSPIRHNVINWIERRWEKIREERQIGRRKDKWKKSRKERTKNGCSDRLYESTTGRQTLEMSAWEQRKHHSEIQMWFKFFFTDWWFCYHISHILNRLFSFCRCRFDNSQWHTCIWFCIIFVHREDNWYLCTKFNESITVWAKFFPLI